MQLNRFTDFGLRVMMYLTQCRDRTVPVTIPEIAARFEISRNHLVKVVHFLSQQGWIVATRGKGGGLRLARDAVEYRIGELVRVLEDQGRWSIAPSLPVCSMAPAASAVRWPRACRRSTARWTAIRWTTWCARPRPWPSCACTGPRRSGRAGGGQP